MSHLGEQVQADRRRRTIYIVSGIGAALAVALLLFEVYSVIVPVILAAFLSYALHPLVDRLEKLHLNRTLASLIIIILVVMIGMAFVLILIPTIISQIQSLMDNFPQYTEKISAIYLEKITPWAQHYLDIKLPRYLADVKKLVSSKLEQTLPIILNTAKKGISGAFTGTLSVAGFIFSLAVIPFFSFFFLRDYHKLLDYLKQCVPYRYRESVFSVSAEIDTNMSRYFRGLLIVLSILTTTYIIGLNIIGLEAAVAMGAISGVLYLFPYIGQTIAYILAMFLALLTVEHWTTFIWISVLYLVTTQVEAWFLTPKIMGDQVGLAPYQVVLLMMIFASLSGVIGMVIAIPVGAMIRIIGRRWWEVYRRSAYYNQPARKVEPPGQGGPASATITIAPREEQQSVKEEDHP